MRPPGWFVDMLKLNHPLVSVRWGQHVARWVIGQRAYVHPSELFYLKRREARLQKWIANPSAGEATAITNKKRLTLANVSEELESARLNERILFMPDALNQATYDLLCHGEHVRYGGYARFADAQEQRDLNEEAEQERVKENKRLALTSEVYDAVDFIGRKKLAELNPSADFGQLLHGRPAIGPLFSAEDF